ncbi:MAG: class I SAM-dependent methyltransferase [Myxococcota bacterium]
MSYPAPFYAALHRGTPGDLAHYRRLCKGASSVLELGCGYGRVVTSLAAPNRTIVGVEPDEQMLGLARDAVAGLPEEDRSGVTLIAGDMRTLDLGRRFDRVLVPFGGLYCMLDDRDLDAALATVARHLAPGGTAGFDVYRADDFHAHAEPDDVPDDAHTPLARVTVDGTDYEVLERSTWDKPAQRIDASYLYVDEVGRTIRGVIEQRYLLQPQLEAALQRAGLELVEQRRDFGSPPEDEDDDEGLIIATVRAMGDS